MRRNNIWSIVATALLVVAILGTLGPGPVRAARWGENYFPNFPVVTHEGKTVRFYDDLIKDRRVVINFVYTTCPDICPLTTARMARVRDFLGDAVGRDLFIYTITLDPETDTPEALRKYAEAFGAGDGWLFLTGKPDQIHEIRWKLGERSRYLAEHRTDMVIGNDPTGFWRRTSVMGSLEVLTRTILDMIPGLRPPTDQTALAESLKKTREDYRIEDHPGEALFLKACSFCHTIGGGEKVGPDLAGVTRRRDHDWLVRFLQDPVALRAMKDPIAVELDRRYAVKMPYLDLSEDDAEDVIVYLETQMKRLATEAEAAATGLGDIHDHNSHDDVH